MSDTRVRRPMAISPDGYIAREDGRLDWIETVHKFKHGETLDSEYVRSFLDAIDCYLMGSRTYLTLLDFEAEGFGWSYGDKLVYLLTSRERAKTRHTKKFHLCDLRAFFEVQVKSTFSDQCGTWTSSIFRDLLRSMSSANLASRVSDSPALSTIAHGPATMISTDS